MKVGTMSNKEREELDKKIIKDYWDMLSKRHNNSLIAKEEKEKYNIEVDYSELSTLFWALREMQEIAGRGEKTTVNFNWDKVDELEKELRGVVFE